MSGGKTEKNQKKCLDKQQAKCIHLLYTINKKAGCFMPITCCM